MSHNVLMTNEENDSEQYLRILNMDEFFSKLLLLTSCFCIICGTQGEAYLHDAWEDCGEWLREPEAPHAAAAAAAAAAGRALACERPDVYICEGVAAAEEEAPEAACSYRGVRLTRRVFRWVAARGCLLYTPDFLYAAGHNSLDLSAACFYGDHAAPCLEISKEDGTCACYPFDPSLEAVAAEVSAALVPAARERWPRCVDVAVSCCAANHSHGAGQCEATFDGWSCWAPADAGTVATQVCSEFAYSNSGPSCDHYSSKRCGGDGVWEVQSEYGACSVAPRLLRRYRFHAAALGVSVAAALPALLLLTCYRRLRVARIALHRNLLLAIVIRNVFVIITRTTIYMEELTSAGETALTRHSVWCRALALGERAAANGVFACMLAEAVALHRALAAVFRRPPAPRALAALVAALTLAPAAVWAALMAALDDHSCWLVYTAPHVQWALDAPRLAVLLLNTALFADVLRVLLTAVRNRDNAQQLSTAKATLFLLPIFGSWFLLTALRPRTRDCELEQLYYYAAYTLEALQGPLVALLYCYINKEVHALIKSTYKKTETAIVSRVGNESRGGTSAAGRRLTASTGLPPAPGAGPPPAAPPEPAREAATGGGASAADRRLTASAGPPSAAPPEPAREADPTVRSRPRTTPKAQNLLTPDRNSTNFLDAITSL